MLDIKSESIIVPYEAIKRTANLLISSNDLLVEMVKTMSEEVGRRFIVRIKKAIEESAAVINML